MVPDTRPDPADLAAPLPHTPAPRWVLWLLGAGAAGLIPWAVSLGFLLPDSTVAENWSLVWIGLDVFITLGLAGSAWLARRRDRRVIPVAAATATLMFSDAWFDVLTSGPELAESLVLAAIELTVATLCLLIAFRAAAPRPRTGPRRLRTLTPPSAWHRPRRAPRRRSEPAIR